MDKARPSTSATALSLSPPPSSAGSVQHEASVTSSHPRKSLVWEYFKYHKSTNQSVCQILSTQSTDTSASDICGHAISGKFPTNCKQHMKKAHPSEFSELCCKEDEEKERERQKSAARATSLKVSQQLTLAESLKPKDAYSKESDH